MKHLKYHNDHWKSPFGYTNFVVCAVIIAYLIYYEQIFNAFLCPYLLIVAVLS